MTCRMAASRMTHMSAWATRRRVVPYTRAVTRGKTFITAQHSPRSSKSTNLWCEWVLITIRQQAGILFLKIKVWASPHPQSLTALLNVLNSADLSACSFLWFFNSRECPCYGKLTWGPRSKKYTSHSLSDLHCEKQLINYTLKRHMRWVRDTKDPYPWKPPNAKCGEIQTHINKSLPGKLPGSSRGLVKGGLEGSQLVGASLTR